MTAAERALLLALFRWARASGVVNVGWRGAPVWRVWGAQGWRVGAQRKFWGVSVARGEHTAPDDFRVRTITEAVDVLVVLGIVPPRFSTAYRAGWDVGRDEQEHPREHAEFMTMIPAHIVADMTARRESEHAA